MSHKLKLKYQSQINEEDKIRVKRTIDILSGEYLEKT